MKFIPFAVHTETGEHVIIQRTIPLRRNPLFKHFKGGTYVLFWVMQIEGVHFAVYEDEKGKAWARPLHLWLNLKKWPDGVFRPAFIYKDS